MGALRAGALQVSCAGDPVFPTCWKGSICLSIGFLVFVYVLDFQYLFKYLIFSICYVLGFSSICFGIAFVVFALV